MDTNDGDLNGNNFRYLDDNDSNNEFAKVEISTLKQYENIYDYYHNVLGQNPMIIKEVR